MLKALGSHKSLNGSERVRGNCGTESSMYVLYCVHRHLVVYRKIFIRGWQHGGGGPTTDTDVQWYTKTSFQLSQWLSNRKLRFWFTVKTQKPPQTGYPCTIE